MIVRTIKHNSHEYEEMKALRTEVLLQPIGIPASYINPEKERKDILIGAFEEDQLIGCCVLTHFNDTTLQLRQMAVRTHLQGTGAGRAVIQFAESIAKQKGYGIIMMHARDAVLEFYKKCGYVVSGDRFFEVGIAHHKMEKSIS